MVLVANDEFFAPKENLLEPADPCSTPIATPTAARRWTAGRRAGRREPGHDWCIVPTRHRRRRSGAVVDTSFFRGNYPDPVLAGGAAVDGDEIEGAEWFDLLPESRWKATRSTASTSRRRTA
jgi:allantoicase